MARGGAAIVEFLKRFWIALTILILIGLSFAEGYLLANGYDASGTATWWIKMFLAVAPNLIADLLAIFVGYGIFRLTAMDHYVETMKAVRKAVQDVPANVKLQPAQVQALMEGLVPIVSKL